MYTNWNNGCIQQCCLCNWLLYWLHQTYYTIETNCWIFRCLAKSSQSIFPHEKHASYSLKTIDEAIKLVEQCESVIQSHVVHFRYDRNKGLKTLNGPKGSVSAATLDSLHLLDFGLRQLKITEKLGHRNINLFSCLTLSLEN